MTPQEFDQSISRVIQSRDYWIEEANKNGMDGKKLIAEEHSKLNNANRQDMINKMK